ncbi:MAG: iron-sulfur cluster assembly accessory protein [Sulfuricellaceae bacterium]|nr:iron-sulfur cluster assembly accessory protein [Sulfuricellaceae bacterium]
MITITPQAAEQIRAAASQNSAESMALRIAARREFDGSMQYGMGFDEERDNDLDYMSEGISILVSAECEPLLKGTTLDFVEYQPGDNRFIFMNPNDTGGSSCGSSSKSGGGCGSGGCGSGGGCS